jgi:4'-phosphopantetheinyl transferase
MAAYYLLMAQMRWRRPPARLTLSGPDVDVWRARLDVDAATFRGLSRLISPDERARAKGFRRTLDRRRFVAARAFLRRILAKYVRVGCRALTFQYDPYGKPQLKGDCGATPVSFNLSHRGDAAMYAVALRRNIGVGLEQLRPVRDCERIARRRFREPDVLALLNLPAEQRRSAFFAYWVRNIALVKATDHGVRGLGVASGDGMTLVDLAPFRGHVAALAVEGTAARVRCWTAT